MATACDFVNLAIRVAQFKAIVMSPNFYELVNDTVIAHVCSHEEVVQVCSEWFLSHEKGIKDLDKVLEIYGGLRDLGHSHLDVLSNLRQIGSIVYLRELNSKIVKISKLPDIRLIRSD